MKQFLITYWIIVALVLIGWVMNIAQIIKMSGFTGLMIIKIIGVVVAPLGSLMGWIGAF
ncbi:hypothetical protein [Acinetobacter baumannii]|uniref:hypothetical protein n=1 Tax=Acinetobacter baumannii TaxID=470 RepID=UPI00366E73E4